MRWSRAAKGERMEKVERDAIVRRLWEWGSALEDCERKQREITRLLEQADSADVMLRAQVLTAMPKGSDVGDPTCKAVLMRDDALRRVDQLLDDIHAIMAGKADTDAQVDKLDPNLKRLLYLRYVRGWGLSYRIPQALHADRRTVYRWHERALEKMSHNVP